MPHALFRTLPVRAIVVGAAAKCLVFLAGLTGVAPAFLGVVDTLASVALAAAGVYLLAKGLALANRRLLWRVRRKLIVSYIFVGFIPSLLVTAFFVLGALFLFSNFSSYLVQNELESVNRRVLAAAAAAADDLDRTERPDIAALLTTRQRALEVEAPGVALAGVPLVRSCPGYAGGSGGGRFVAGTWAHVEAPDEMPGWLGDCSGFSGLVPFGEPTGVAPRRPAETGAIPTESGAGREVGLIVRAVAFAPRANYAVVADVVVDAALKARIRDATGVELTTFQPVSGAVTPLAASRPPDAVAPRANSRLPLTSVTFLEDRDWGTGALGTLVAPLRLSLPDIYLTLSTSPSGGSRTFSESLLALLAIIGVLFLIIQALAFVVGLVLARSITGSVHELFEGTARVRQGDFRHKMKVRAHDQLGDLAQSFNQMTDRLEILMQEQAEKKRLEEELRIAHDIQMSLLPQGPLRMPGLTVTATSVPAREVGGDYYDFLPLDEHRVGILIADVSGKGTSAALYMAELKGLILSLSRIHTSPRDLLVAANRIIADHLDSKSFITMTYAVLDLRLRTMRYARAGHTPLVYVPAGGPDRDVRVLAPDGMVVGLKLDDGEMFERLLVEETMTIHDGDLLLLFTDGITEAMDASDDCFGELRLGRTLEQAAHLPPDQVRERVLGEIAAFVGDAPQHDDMTLLLIRIGDAPGRPAADLVAQATALTGQR